MSSLSLGILWNFPRFLSTSFASLATTPRITEVCPLCDIVLPVPLTIFSALLMALLEIYEPCYMYIQKSNILASLCSQAGWIEFLQAPRCFFSCSTHQSTKSQLLIKTKIQTKKCLASSPSDVVFIMLINVKMPTIVGILTFICRSNFVLS